MKKVVASIMIISYLLVTCGIIINTHYCMNRVASVHLFELEAKICGNCGMETHASDGCCRDEVKIVKLEQDQNKVPVIIFSISAPELPFIIPSGFIAASFYNCDINKNFYYHSPPLLSEQDTYLQNNVFRI